jgi:hypothetical protein
MLRGAKKVRGPFLLSTALVAVTTPARLCSETSHGLTVELKSSYIFKGESHGGFISVVGK